MKLNFLRCNFADQSLAAGFKMRVLIAEMLLP